MKSKSFDLKSSSAQKHTLDKTFDFVGLYKPAAETNKVTEKRKSDESINKEIAKNKTGTPKRESSPNQNKKRSKQEVDISQINIDGSNLNSGLAGSSPIRDSKVTSTPYASLKNQGENVKVKSIMKNKSPTEQSVNSAKSVSIGKPKKRNKSVSFMLDDTEEVVVKRTKSDDSIKVNKKVENTANTKLKEKKKHLKKIKQNKQAEKENKADEGNNQNMDVDSTKDSLPDKKPAKPNKTKKMLAESPAGPAAGNSKMQTQDNKEKKKKLKKGKKTKPELNSEYTDTENNNNDVLTETKLKKKVKSPPVETTQAEGEPVPKSRKKESKPDITEDLENLSIGDNTHTLTNLLDEMTVVDKDKNKKLRQKFNKNKKPKGSSKEASSKDGSEKSDEVKEKVKWKKRKWNKDKKGDADEEVTHTVMVENLPISIMLNYRKLLTEIFVKHGLIKKIGIAEVYPTEESKPVFTTTINFYSDGGAEQALQENSSYIEGSRIRVKRALPATQTTLVVRSYAELTDQALSSTFHGAGKIRSIRHLVKGKKTMATAFVEFDGPEAVERAIKTGDAKIGGKKVYLAKFEVRTKKVPKHKNDGDSAADADSEDSND